MALTQKEFARMGGHARAKRLSKKELSEISRKAGLAAAKKRREAGKKDSEREIKT